MLGIDYDSQSDKEQQQQQKKRKRKQFSLPPALDSLNKSNNVPDFLKHKKQQQEEEEEPETAAPTTKIKKAKTISAPPTKKLSTPTKDEPTMAFTIESGVRPIIGPEAGRPIPQNKKQNTKHTSQIATQKEKRKVKKMGQTGWRAESSGGYWKTPQEMKMRQEYD